MPGSRLKPQGNPPIYRGSSLVACGGFLFCQVLFLRSFLHCVASPKNLPRRFIQRAGVGEFWLDSLLMKLAQVMDHRSLPLAIAPCAFLRGEFLLSACLAGGCGFVMADSVWGSGAAAPGKRRRYFSQDWRSIRTGSAPTLLQKDLCGYVASSTRVFSALALGTVYGPLLVDRELVPRREAFPRYHLAQKRRGWG
jgi:hypothetical protein